MKPLVLILIILIAAAVAVPLLRAESSNLGIAYEALRDSTYNDEPLAEVEARYAAALEELAVAFVGPRERSLWASRLEYMMGRAYQVRECKEAAAEHYERGLEQAEQSMAGGAHSEGWRMMSENISQLCLVEDLGFLLANGRKVAEYAEKAQALDPGNVAAQIILAAAKVYPPAVVGGNPRTGIVMMQQALDLGATEKDDLFNIYSGMALAHSKLGRKEEACAWFEKALQLYPGNEYVTEEYRKLGE
ncbi:MAG: tetratricopeptide repeat protein [Spirochaetales bacterium]|nr:tetratricopeptide repeat protein [Spirochaetales bacterium]